MVNTTKDGETPVVLPKTNEDKIVALYVEGKNLYDIAAAVYEFGGDEVMEHIRQVLQEAGYLDETHRPPVNAILEA